MESLKASNEEKTGKEQLLNTSLLGTMMAYATPVTIKYLKKRKVSSFRKGGI